MKCQLHAVLGPVVVFVAASQAHAGIPVVGGPVIFDPLLTCMAALQRFRSRPDVVSFSVVDPAELAQQGRGKATIDETVRVLLNAPSTALLLWIGADAQGGPKAALLSAEVPECAQSAPSASRRNLEQLDQSTSRSVR